MKDKCLDCGKRTLKKELKKYGGICDKCANAVELYNEKK